MIYIFDTFGKSQEKMTEILEKSENFLREKMWEPCFCKELPSKGQEMAYFALVADVHQ